jgi:hypothetical protein
MKLTRQLIFAAMVFALGLGGNAAAQQTVMKAMEDREAAEKKKAEEAAKQKAALEAAKKGPPKTLPDGWHPFLAVGTTLQIGTASNVVGRVDGETYSIGATVNGRLNLKRGQHEWNNRLAFQVQQTNAPGLSGWIKSLDLLKIESNYVWSPSPNIGVYAGGSVDTSLFGTEDVRAGPTEYRIKEVNGTFSGDFGGVTKAGGGLKQVLLARELAPTTIGQGVGANIKVWEGYGHKFQARVGLGAQEVFARNAIAIADDPLTPTLVEALRLRDFQQVGAQIRFTADGALRKNITYGFLGEVLLPFYNSIDTGKGFVDTVNVAIDLKVGFKMTKWFSLEYVLGARRQPLLVDKWQIWQGLLASFAFNLIE